MERKRHGYAKQGHAEKRNNSIVIVGSAPMKVKKWIEIGEWPGRIIPKNKTGLAYDKIEMSIYELGEYFHISEEEILRRLAERMGESRMIKCKEGTVNIDGDVIETMADLSCIVKAIQDIGMKEGRHPVMSALKTLKYVVIGLTYRGEA